MLGIKEAAVKLGVAEITFRRWVKDGVLTHYRIGRRIKFGEKTSKTINRVGGLKVYQLVAKFNDDRMPMKAAVLYLIFELRRFTISAIESSMSLNQFVQILNDLIFPKVINCPCSFF